MTLEKVNIRGLEKALKKDPYNKRGLDFNLSALELHLLFDPETTKILQRKVFEKLKLGQRCYLDRVDFVKDKLSIHSEFYEDDDFFLLCRNKDLSSKLRMFFVNFRKEQILDFPDIFDLDWILKEVKNKKLLIDQSYFYKEINGQEHRCLAGWYAYLFDCLHPYFTPWNIAKNKCYLTSAESVLLFSARSTYKLQRIVLNSLLRGKRLPMTGLHLDFFEETSYLSERIPNIILHKGYESRLRDFLGREYSHSITIAKGAYV